MKTKRVPRLENTLGLRFTNYFYRAEDCCGIIHEKMMLSAIKNGLPRTFATLSQTRTYNWEELDEIIMSIVRQVRKLIPPNIQRKSLKKDYTGTHLFDEYMIDIMLTKF